MTEWDDVARVKLARVLGKARAEHVFRETLARKGGESLASANDLYEFGELLSSMGGFEAAVGAVLTLHAVMRGASPKGAQVT